MIAMEICLITIWKYGREGLIYRTRAPNLMGREKVYQKILSRPHKPTKIEEQKTALASNVHS